MDHYLFGSWKPIVSDIYDKFHIVKIEEYKEFIQVPVLPHRRPVYFFVYLTSGTMIRSKNLTQYELKKNNFYCLPAYEISSLEWISEDIKGYYCQFLPEIFNQSQLKIDIIQDFPFFDIIAEPLLLISNPKKVLNSLEVLYNKNYDESTSSELIIALQLLILLNEIKSNFINHPIKPRGAASKITKEFKDILSTKIETIKKVSDVSDMLSISPNHLNKSVKKATGKSAHELLSEMRILQAKVLLKQTDLQIQEIAFKVGDFASSDFIRFFKKNTGLTPNEYRNLQD